ncbi:helix-turn-helix domain-containing protein [Enterocloster bolteae]|jgi:transposase|uniref:helix-turn-helix domain-containing protein n=1 Tax=Enterocloster bolteae TaxID=208479 RepID=UPI00148C5867|nr:helix-turn-helix domain-containing protein [Enterocloster bolteae]QJU22663.1 helix-turn-helix domain-containing protein [Enterocloster bolteae]
MNQVAEEMKDILMHYGTPRHSGRYPWGSGENPYQRNGDFLSRVDELKGQGLSDTEIAKAMGLTTTQFRTQRSLAKDERRALEVERAKALQSDGYNPSEIARMMGYNSESSIRSLLNSDSEARMNQARVTAENLKRQVDEHGMIAISAGTERYLGVSREKLEEALYILELEGYNHFGGGVPQVTNKGQQTNIRVLCPPDTPYKEITRTYTDKNGEVHEKVTKVSSAIYDFDKVHPLEEVCDSISYDNGDSFQKGFHYPTSMNSDRIQVVYAEQGGTKKDGVIELRRGVDDLSLGDAHYAQVRILVDGTHYLKGMAMYADDLPDGVDVRFNTNKKEGTPVCGPKDNTVLKTIKKDPNNPFGSLIKEHGGQSFYDDPNGEFTDPKTGKKQSLSLINKRAEEGDWSDWDDKLPSQFLSKQSLKLIKNQLSLTMADAQAEYDEICSLTNPTVKKVLLQSFADDCDAAAVHLKAASLPRQKYKVILPITSMKDDEVYAPGYENGEKVALIRFPHGGTFEIPVLTVNNKQAEAKSKLGLAKDAVGINSKVAERLSGADFDGDTVMIVPTGKGVKITSTPPLKGLEGFDGKLEYGHDSTKTDPDGTVHYYRNGREFKPMKNTQTEMGIISNLITDMTLRGAKEEELAKAVRHSMVVIDAEKHGLDYKQSEKDNDIAYLKKTYQGTTDANGRYHEGAATLISRSKSQQEVLKRKGSPKVNQKGKDWYDPSKPEGSLIWNSVTEEYTDKNGKVKVRTQKSTKMAETDDARLIISDADTPQERAYAEYANQRKDLANKARLEIINTGKIAYSASAKATYKEEVDGMLADLNIALRNAPKETQAQIIANSKVAAMKKANPDMTSKEIKKASQQALTEARIQMGAERIKVPLDEKRWEAIQAGAISESQLIKILNNSDIDEVRQYATPRTTSTLSPAKVNKIEAMQASGNYSIAEIAQAVGVSSSTVSKYLK